MPILVVDDDPDSRRLLALFLGNAGYPDVRTADSAAAALRQLAMEHPSGTDGDIDLILSDISMPEIDGVELCRRIKTTPSLHDTPIIMVTGSTELADLERAFAVGAMDYITKPVRKVELLARVRSALRLKREMDDRKARERELVEVTRRLAAANAQLELVASLDGLTGIPNRRHFDTVLDVECRRAARNRTWLSLLLLDIDYFKAYNDTHGHQAGDACLQRVAQCLQASARRPADLAARYGGEEFALVLPDTPLAGAAALAEVLRTQIEALGVAHGASAVSTRVTVSLGVATALPAPRSSPITLIAAADQALYQAKHAGRNRVHVADVLRTA